MHLHQTRETTVFPALQGIMSSSCIHIILHVDILKRSILAVCPLTRLRQITLTTTLLLAAGILSGCTSEAESPYQTSQQRLSSQKLDPGGKVAWPDGTHLTATSNAVSETITMELVEGSLSKDLPAPPPELAPTTNTFYSYTIPAPDAEPIGVPGGEYLEVSIPISPTQNPEDLVI